MRIAVVYSRVPFPMMRGDQMTVAHLISFLAARGHDVDLYTMKIDGEMSPEQSSWLDEACRHVHFYEQGIVQKLVGLIIGVMRLLPLQIGMFRNKKLANDLADAVGRDEYDIVYCYYPRTAPAIPKNHGSRARTFLALQLSQTLNTRRMAEHESNLLKKLVFRIEAVLMGRFESRVWQEFERVVLIGPADVEAVREQCSKHGQPEIDNWIYGAHGTDTDKYVPATDEEVVAHRVVFSGSMLYPPNVQAATWFVDHVWPTVRAQVPDATLVIQGRDPAASIRAMDGKDGIWVTGTVPDVGVVIRSAHVCINPMLAAGGMQNKLIEYMASAKAVVATTVANEGIMAPHGTLLVADGERAFAEAVVELLGDQARAHSLGVAASEYVRANWTWEKHFLDLEDNFVKALADA